MNRARFPFDLEILDKIVPCSPYDGIVIHLRLGDVLEHHTRTVTQFLSGVIDPSESNELLDGIPLRFSNDGSTSEGYVKSRVYYEQLIQDSEQCPKHVTIIGGTHKTMPMTKSIQYVDAVRAIFQQNGFTVIPLISLTPSVTQTDLDFTMMVNAAYFVPSGGQSAPRRTESCGMSASSYGFSLPPCTGGSCDRNTDLGRDEYRGHHGVRDTAANGHQHVSGSTGQL